MASRIISSTTQAGVAVAPNMTRRHPGSLIPKFMHHPQLLELVKSPVTKEMIGEWPCLTLSHTLASCLPKNAYTTLLSLSM
jgi:hypothetical protein